MPAYTRALLGALIGGLLGFTFYKLVGCRTGSCPLSANPWIATVLWALMGALFAWRP